MESTLNSVCNDKNGMTRVKPSIVVIDLDSQEEKDNKREREGEKQQEKRQEKKQRLLDMKKIVKVKDRRQSKEKNYIKTHTSFLSTHSFQGYKDLIEACVDEIRDSLMENPPIVVWGKQAIQHRSVGFFSTSSKGYYYASSSSTSTARTVIRSNNTHRPECQPQKLSENLKTLLQEVNVYFKSDFNGILVNKYKNGDDYIGRHSDDERELDPIGVVALSVGAVRKFRIREKRTAKTVLDLETLPYHLIQMGGDFQKHYTHEIPVQRKVKEIRYSFTFRKHRN